MSMNAVWTPIRHSLAPVNTQALLTEVVKICECPPKLSRFSDSLVLVSRAMPKRAGAGLGRRRKSSQGARPSSRLGPDRRSVPPICDSVPARLSLSHASDLVTTGALAECNVLAAAKPCWLAQRRHRKGPESATACYCWRRPRRGHGAAWHERRRPPRWDLQPERARTPRIALSCSAAAARRRLVGCGLEWRSHGG